MNTKVLLTASLAANALLLSVEVYLLRQEPSDLSTVPPLVVCIAHRGPDAVGPPGASAESAANPALPCDWRWVKSDDYKQYVADLHSRGCSDKAVRDLVMADVNQLFRTRARGQAFSANLPQP
jgi:hypothetical protein